jgi:hypothetical protein
MGLFKDCGCGCNGKKQEKKLMISFTAALVFFLIASPDTFRVMRKIVGKWVAGPNGCPTSSGLAFHAVVFMFVTWGMMNLKSEGYTTETIGPAPQDVVEEEMEEEVDVSELELQTEDVSMDLELSDIDTIVAPPRMADAPLPLPGMNEEPVGMFDSGAMYAPMDLSSESDKPQALKFSMSSLSVSCADGSKPIVR